MMINTIGEKFVHDLMLMHDAEQRFLMAQQKMLSNATSEIVRNGLIEHINQTQSQINNLGQVFALLGSSPATSTSDAAVGLVNQGDAAMMATSGHPALLDSAIVGAAIEVEHYEIAAYRNLIGMAEHFGQPGLLQLLQANLAQEERTAEKLTQIAKDLLNFAGAAQKLNRTDGVNQIVIG